MSTRETNLRLVRTLSFLVEAFPNDQFSEILEQWMFVGPENPDVKTSTEDLYIRVSSNFASIYAIKF